METTKPGPYDVLPPTRTSSKVPTEPRPSLATHDYWLPALRNRCSFYSTRKTGKWCIFRTTAEIDEAWERVYNAVERGDLHFAKVATLASARRHEGGHVICVFTRDWQDDAELDASRAVLRSIGFTEPLGYKRDIETMNDVYGTPDEWYRTV